MAILTTTASAMKQWENPKDNYNNHFKLGFNGSHLRLSYSYDEATEELQNYLKNESPDLVTKISFGKNVAIEAVKLLSQFKNLKTVSFADCKESIPGFIKHLPYTIKELNLSNCRRSVLFGNTSLDTKELSLLKSLKGLKELDLSWQTNIDLKTLEKLSPCIEDLNLAFTGIKKLDDEFIKKNFPNLKRLVVGSNKEIKF